MEAIKIKEKTYEEVVIGIIINGGDARFKAMQAIKTAREGQLEEADALIKESNEAVAQAHRVQTDLIQAEARGEKSEVSLLMIHAQDHLMNAMTIRDLAVEMIEEIKNRIRIEKKLEELV